MDEKRLGEIALKIVKQQLRKVGLRGENFNREMGNAAKDIGIPKDELRSFYESLLPEILGEMLGRKSVSLITKD